MENKFLKPNLTCGVRNCNSSRKNGSSLYRIPKGVRCSQTLMKQWSLAIGRTKPFPKSFLICGKHFDKIDVLKGVTAMAKLSRLTHDAVPKKNLPAPSDKSPHKVRVGRISKPYLKTERLRKVEFTLKSNEEILSNDLQDNTTQQSNEEICDVEFVSDDLQENTNDQMNEEELMQILANSEEEVSDGQQENTSQQSNEDLSDVEEILNDLEEHINHQSDTNLSDQLEENATHDPIDLEYLKVETPEKLDKCIQVNLIGLFVGNTALWDTDKKLYIMTGLPDFNTLNVLIKACQKIRPIDKMLMSIKDRILLTMYKLKTNCSFAELAISFELSDKSAKLYFVDTITLLAKATKGLIYWQTKEDNNKSRPNSFKPFPNVRTVLNCIEINSVYFQTLESKPHSKGSYSLQVLIGVAPSGYINYLSKVKSAEESGETKFNLSELFDKLVEGDAVIVDKELVSENEFLIAGVELIDVRQNTQTMAAKVYIERKITGVIAFKALSEKIHKSMEPYIDDVITVISGLSNLKRSQIS